MAVRFKLDENLPRDAEALLRDAGHDVRTVLDERLGGNSDAKVLDAALIDLWHREKGMLAFALRGPGMMATVIDVLVRPLVSFDELKRNAVTKRVGPLSIPVASIDDLIRLKTGTGRSKDVLDIEELRKIKRQLADEQHGQG